MLGVIVIGVGVRRNKHGQHCRQVLVIVSARRVLTRPVMRVNVGGAIDLVILVRVTGH